MSILPSLLGPHLAMNPELAVCTAAVSVSSFVHQLSCVQKTLFPYSYPPSLTLTSFLDPLPHRALVLGGGG